ncbi:MAG: metallophosphoesterase family protein [Acholeplasmataceae bacterium]|jgi:putative phosphoesterase|nr:metallophosphoesterase family protein [Acholeplasmataceae bacterium]
MRLLITSDVHGKRELLEQVIRKHKNIDDHLNAGDMAMRPEYYEPYHLITVKGNNDFGVDLPYVRILDIGDKKIMLTHGHIDYVKFGLDRLKLKAKIQKVDIVIFGHTHQRYLMMEENILFINPGALGDYQRSYAIYHDGQVTFYQE